MKEQIYIDLTVQRDPVRRKEMAEFLLHAFDTRKTEADRTGAPLSPQWRKERERLAADVARCTATAERAQAAKRVRVRRDVLKGLIQSGMATAREARKELGALRA